MREPSPSTRASLIVRLRDPADAAAWEEFTAIYGPLVRRLARAKGFQDADAADLSQDVFRAVAGAIDRWDPDPNRGSFRGWLFRIARNLIVNFLAAQKRRPRASGDSAMRELLEQQPARELDPDDSALLETEYRRELFSFALRRTREQFREATWQAFQRTAVDLEPPAVVAQELGMTLGALYVARTESWLASVKSSNGLRGMNNQSTGFPQLARS